MSTPPARPHCKTPSGQIPPPLLVAASRSLPDLRLRRMFRTFEHANQLALGEYVAMHCLDEILAIRARAQIEHLVRCKNFEMIVMGRIAFRGTRPFVSHAAGGR